MNKTLSVKTPLDKSMLLPLRLLAGGLGAVAKLAYDDIEDLKVALQETLMILQNYGYESAEIRFEVMSGLHIFIKGENLTNKNECDFSSMLIAQQLVDTIEYDSKNFGDIKIIKALR